MAANKRRRHTVRNIVLIALLVCVIAAAAAGAALWRKISALQNGAQFEFAYTVTPTGSETPVLYTVLEKASATQGSLYGVYAPNKLLLSLYQLSGDTPAASWSPDTRTVTLHSEAKADEPFTRVYIDSDETLYDVGQLYETARQAIISAYPIASALLPEWSLGNYISQTQLSTLLGVDTSKVEMQEMADFALILTALKRVEPTDALEGCTYFRLEIPNAEQDSPELIIGVPLSGLFNDEIPLHILLTIPQHSAKIELLGTLSAADSTIISPTSRMQDEDIEVFAQIRQTVEELLQFVQQNFS